MLGRPWMMRRGIVSLASICEHGSLSVPNTGPPSATSTRRIEAGYSDAVIGLARAALRTKRVPPTCPCEAFVVNACCVSCCLWSWSGLPVSG